MANFPITDCGKVGGKQCVGAPEPTCLSSGICTFLVKYSFEPILAPELVQFELFGIPPMAGSMNFWIGLGLNHVTGSMVKKHQWFQLPDEELLWLILGQEVQN